MLEFDRIGTGQKELEMDINVTLVQLEASRRGWTWWMEGW